MDALRRHPVVVAIAAVGLVVALVVGTTAFAVWRAAHTDDASHVDHADVILVLGAAQYDGDPSPVFEGRLRHAALLYREGGRRTIMVLGGSAPGDRTSEAEAGRDWWSSRGVPTDAVVASPVGQTTLESLEAAAGWMQERGLESAFLVSDPWHNLRVKRMASDLGIEAYASATWQSAARTEGTRFDGYFRETLAYLFYRFGRSVAGRTPPTTPSASRSSESWNRQIRSYLPVDRSIVADSISPARARGRRPRRRP